MRAYPGKRGMTKIISQPYSRCGGRNQKPMHKSTERLGYVQFSGWKFSFLALSKHCYLNLKGTETPRKLPSIMENSPTSRVPSRRLRFAW